MLRFPSGFRSLNILKTVIPFLCLVGAGLGVYEHHKKSQKISLNAAQGLFFPHPSIETKNPIVTGQTHIFSIARKPAHNPKNQQDLAPSQNAVTVKRPYNVQRKSLGGRLVRYESPRLAPSWIETYVHVPAPRTDKYHTKHSKIPAVRRHPMRYEKRCQTQEVDHTEEIHGDDDQSLSIHSAHPTQSEVTDNFFEDQFQENQEKTVALDSKSQKKSLSSHESQSDEEEIHGDDNQDLSIYSVHTTQSKIIHDLVEDQFQENQEKTAALDSKSQKEFLSSHESQSDEENLGQSNNEQVLVTQRNRRASAPAVMYTPPPIETSPRHTVSADHSLENQEESSVPESDSEHQHSQHNLEIEDDQSQSQYPVLFSSPRSSLFFTRKDFFQFPQNPLFRRPQESSLIQQPANNKERLQNHKDLIPKTLRLQPQKTSLGKKIRSFFIRHLGAKKILGETPIKSQESPLRVPKKSKMDRLFGCQKKSKKKQSVTLQPQNTPVKSIQELQPLPEQTQFRTPVQRRALFFHTSQKFPAYGGVQGKKLPHSHSFKKNTDGSTQASSLQPPSGKKASVHYQKLPYMRTPRPNFFYHAEWDQAFIGSCLLAISPAKSQRRLEKNIDDTIDSLMQSPGEKFLQILHDIRMQSQIQEPHTPSQQSVPDSQDTSPIKPVSLHFSTPKKRQENVDNRWFDKK